MTYIDAMTLEGQDFCHSCGQYLEYRIVDVSVKTYVMKVFSTFYGIMLGPLGHMLAVGIVNHLKRRKQVYGHY